MSSTILEVYKLSLFFQSRVITHRIPVILYASVYTYEIIITYPDEWRHLCYRTIEVDVSASLGVHWFIMSVVHVDDVVYSRAKKLKKNIKITNAVYNDNNNNNNNKSNRAIKA